MPEGGHSAPQAIGLGDFGKPGNYFARQVERWTKQYRASETDVIPEMDRLIEDFLAAATEEEQLAAAEALQEGWNELAPAMVLGPTAELTAWQDDVHGVASNSNTMVLLDEAWVS